ncbi:hypothetical protein P4S72_26705 [Vibrio sp. PP-XX7]
MSCVGKDSVPPAKISLVYKDSSMSEIGFSGYTQISSFNEEALNQFKLRCDTEAKFSVVHSSDIANTDWDVKLQSTDGDPVDELANFGQMLLSEANSVLLEHDVLSRLNMQDADLNNQIIAEMNGIWGQIAENVTVEDFFGAGNVPKRYQGKESLFVSQTDMNLTNTGSLFANVPNFDVLNQLVAENPEIGDLDNLFNFDFDYITDDWGDKNIQRFIWQTGTSLFRWRGYRIVCPCPIRHRKMGLQS